MSREWTPWIWMGFGVSPKETQDGCCCTHYFSLETCLTLRGMLWQTDTEIHKKNMVWVPDHGVRLFKGYFDKALHHDTIGQDSLNCPFGNFLSIRGLPHLWMNKKDWRCQRCSFPPCFLSWALSCPPLAVTGYGIATHSNFPRMRDEVVHILSFLFLSPPPFMFSFSAGLKFFIFLPSKVFSSSVFPLLTPYKILNYFCHQKRSQS